MIIAIAVLAALLTGFVAGLVSFKRTNEYCGQHGVTRTCPLCSPLSCVPAGSTTCSDARLSVN